MATLLSHQFNLNTINDELIDIIERKAISTVYQPIISLRNGEFLGFEALTRGPETSALRSPLELFRVAEESGCLYPLERICREKAIKSFAKPAVDTYLFLNLNPQSLKDPQFTPGLTRKLLHKKGLREEQIVFEITERQSIDDFEAFKIALLHYRRQGYLVAIDDAGAGYSSLQAIAELEPDFIKLDKSLIKGFDKNHVKAAIVEAFVTLTNKLGSKVIVEGIETLSEFKKAQELKVHYAQGYFIARPDNPCPVINPEIASIF